MTEQEIRWAQLQIQKARKDREWSQESVCKGICAVSYYSKIETGTVSCSAEILEQLASRLNLSLAAANSKRKEQCELIFDLLRRGRHLQAKQEFIQQFPDFAPILQSNPIPMPYPTENPQTDKVDKQDMASQMNSDAAPCRISKQEKSSGSQSMTVPSQGGSPCVPIRQQQKEKDSFTPWIGMGTEFHLPEEYLLVELFCQIKLRTLFGNEFLECLSAEEQAICHVLDGQYEKAMNLCTQGWIRLLAAQTMYQNRMQETQILDCLQQAFMQAGREGYPYLMAQASHMAGMVCANLPDLEGARPFLERAMNLYRELNDPLGSGEVKYNLACTLLELKEYEKALTLLQNLPDQSVLDIHKQVICLEQLGRKEQALALLETYPQASYLGWDPKLIDQIFEVCRYRLCDPDWLKNPEYGQALCQLFDTLCSSDLHKGFAQFHLPWVIQYLKASRQYAAVVRLLETFPGKPSFILP